jgi:hypothetical protein
MSLALEQDSESLSLAIRRARAHGITIICSTADEGHNVPIVFPAAYTRETLSVAACNHYGSLAKYGSDQAKYYFQGDKLVTDVQFSEDSPVTVSGSSVGTAVAAGVASLIMACHRIAAAPRQEEERPRIVEHWFNEMTKGPGEPKYVKPWVVFGEEERGDGDEDWLSELFNKR